MSKKKALMSHDPLAMLDGEELTKEVAEIVPEASPKVEDSSVVETVSEIIEEGGSEVESVAEPAAAEESSEEGGSALVFAESLTIADVGEMKEKMQALLDLGGAIVLDAGEIETIDSAGMQLLTALVKEANSRSQDITWQAVSEKVSNAAQGLGLTEILNINAEKQAA